MPAWVTTALAPTCPGTLPLTAVMVITTASTPSRRQLTICPQESMALLDVDEGSRLTRPG